MNDYTLGGMVVCDSYDQAKGCLKYLTKNTKIILAIPTKKLNL